jgi:hypothetical protein
VSNAHGSSSQLKAGDGHNDDIVRNAQQSQIEFFPTYQNTTGCEILGNVYVKGDTI